MFLKFCSNLSVKNYSIRNKLCRNYSVTVPGVGKTKKKSKFGSLEKIEIPVETDAEKLTKYLCGSNIMKEGEDILLRDDNEYPDWLWGIYTGKPKKLEELDPETKEYWFKVKKMCMVQNNKMSKIRKF